MDDISMNGHAWCHKWRLTCGWSSKEIYECLIDRLISKLIMYEYQWTYDYHLHSWITISYKKENNETLILILMDKPSLWW